MSRTADDWDIDSSLVAGRSIVFFDDVFVTGASLSSYATALERAGATGVRAIAIVRHLPHTHWNYWDARRIVKHNHEWLWEPSRATIAHVAAGRSEHVG